jgi:glycosyltransferase involved in cell wall biosynthesis
MHADVIETCARLRERYDVRVMAPHAEVRAFAQRRLWVEGWKPLGFLGVFLAVRRLRVAVQGFRPDLVHAHGWPAISLALGTFPDALAGRTIASFHDPLRNRELPQKLVDARFPLYLKRAAVLTSAYPTLARALERRFDFPADTFSIVPHGVDGLEDGDPELERAPGRPGPVFGWYGRLAPDPAWQTAIDTLAALRKDLPAARLIVAGDGPSRQFVAAHARQKRVDDAVEFRGDLDQSTFFNAIDLLVSPITVDAQPEIVLAALCRGIPVVAANAGAFKDALEGMPCGWLVPDDVAGFAEGVRDAWAGIDEAWRQAALQRHVARSTYMRETVLARLEATYARVDSP